MQRGENVVVTCPLAESRNSARSSLHGGYCAECCVMRSTPTCGQGGVVLSWPPVTSMNGISCEVNASSTPIYYTTRHQQRLLCRTCVVVTSMRLRALSAVNFISASRPRRRPRRGVYFHDAWQTRKSFVRC